MPIVKVQAEGGNYSGNVTAGNILIIHPTGGYTTPTDTLANSWTKLAEITDSGGVPQQVWWAKANATGATTVSVPGANQLEVWELSGEHATSAIDAVDSAAAFTNSLSCSVTTTGPGRYVMAFFTSGAGYYSSGGTNGFTDDLQNVNNQFVQEAFKVGSAAATETVVGTNAGAHPVSVILIAIAPAAAGPTSDFTTSVNQKTVTLTDASTAGPNPITSYDTDWGDGTAHMTTASGSHTYAVGGAYTITHTVSDGTTPNSATHSVTTKTRHTFAVVRVPGGAAASVTADVPDA